jgi:hypothetical protein
MVQFGTNALDINITHYIQEVLFNIAADELSLFLFTSPVCCCHCYQHFIPESKSLQFQQYHDLPYATHP